MDEIHAGDEFSFLSDNLSDSMDKLQSMIVNHKETIQAIDSNFENKPHLLGAMNKEIDDTLHKYL